MTIHAAARTARSTRAVGWVPFALVVLVLVPAVAEYVIRRPARRRAISRTTINHRSIRATAKVGS